MTLKSVVTVGREIEIQQLAMKVGERVFAADDISEALDVVRRVNPDLILLDHWFGQNEIDEFATVVDGISDAHVVVIGNGDDQVAVEFKAIKAHYLNGKQDYYRLHRIADQIKNKLRISTSKTGEDAFFADSLAAAVGMVGKSKAMRHTLKMINIVASSQCNPILIIGQTGTGKEVAAKAIHHHRHPDKPFVAVNCAALTANLLESELFGHVKGSFTSADREKTGLLEMAGSGSIFLDEISEMPRDLQAKLLRMIQEKTFRKVGGTKEITCQATIIASSNRNLKEEAQAGRFREDLYHRLSIFPVVLSPLNSPHRREDIPLLADYVLKTSTISPEKSKNIRSITKLAIEALIAHDWSGNVRELCNVMERAIMLEGTDKIGLSSIIINPEEPQSFFTEIIDEKVKDFSLVKAEQELIARVLRETNWQKTKAAKLLGISRATLYAKVKQHNIETDDCPEQGEEDVSVLAQPEPAAVA